MSTTRCYPDKAPKVDTLMDTLSDNLRRELIHYFETVTTADTASLDEVITHIDGRVPTATPTSVRTALHHKHLPKLQTRGWIAYDARSEDIRYLGHENAEQLLTEVVTVFSE